MIIKRVFYPIGQGSFYVEKIFTRNKTYNIVYDCGTVKGSTKQSIDNAFKKGESIDILFISHFDKDHISGIKALIKRCNNNINKIIIPLINNENKWFYLLDGNCSKIISDIVEDRYSEVFNTNISISMIKPIKDIKEKNKEIYLKDHKGPINSGDIMRLNHEINWCYIPFNFCHQQRLNDLLTNFNKTKNEIYEEICSSLNLGKSMSYINKKYGAITNNNSNLSSLIVYSGCKTPTTTSVTCYQNSTRHINNIINEGCLYLGDICLNQSYINENERTIHIINELQEYFPQNRKQKVGLVQVPHHGSDNNFNENILNYFPNIGTWFVSYGINNRHSHPTLHLIRSSETSTTRELLGITLLEITQDPTSQVNQLIFI